MSKIPHWVIPPPARKQLYKFKMSLLELHSPLPLPLAGGWMWGMKFKWWLLRELEPETGAFIKQFFKEHPGRTFIDVGANAGYFTVMASKAGAKVISYEPDATSYALLQKILN
jgi:hypothetical protein